MQDIEALISRGVDVLVIVAFNPAAMSKAVEARRSAGVPVICYDRMITDCDVSLYVSFDNIRVGQLQAEYLVARLGGQGRIVRIYGPKTDHTGLLFKQGQDLVLAPLIENGAIEVIHEDYAEGWKPESAKKITNAAITAKGTDFDAVLATNDGTAGGAVQALLEEGLAGRILVTGQDADLAACQRIRRGWQTMSIYKPLARLAETAAEAAYSLATHEVLIVARIGAKRFQRGTRFARGCDCGRRRQPPRDGRQGWLPQGGRSPLTRSPVLEARQVTKRFGGVQALADVSFAVAGGEIHALCGENGAGKSTLMNILTGLLPAGSYEGQVRVEDHRVQFRDVRDAELAGIGIVHQELALVDSLSVAENILLGRFPRRGCRVDWPATYDAADRILREFQVPIDPETPVAELGVGQQQLVEIARAISKHPRILLLDEPTAALSSTETEILLEHVRRLSATGVACVYISHKLEEVLAVADRITVLRDGARPSRHSRPQRLISRRSSATWSVAKCEISIHRGAT